MSPVENRLLHSIDKRVVRIEQAVLGNGVPGIAATVQKHGDWIDTRPKDCPAYKDRKTVMAIRMAEIAVMGVILTAAQIVLRVLRVM